MEAEQFMTRTLRTSLWGRDVAQILAAAVTAVDPYHAVKEYLRFDDGCIVIGDQPYALEELDRIFVVGAGKAAIPMAEGVVEVLGDLVTGGLTIVKIGQVLGEKEIGAVEIRQAGHPLPDAFSMKASDEMIEMLQNAGERDLVIALISGGGSSLLTSPVEGIKPEDLREIVEILFACGADIKEFNTVRQQIDRVKGGGLARIAAPSRVAAMVLSDVVGDPIEFISSGPTVASGTTHEDALRVIHKYHLEDKIPKRVLQLLEQPTPVRKAVENAYTILVGNNERAARAALKKAQEMGFLTKMRSTMLEGDARQLGQKLATQWRSVVQGEPRFEQPVLLLFGGETTVNLQGSGVGGRNHELALAAVHPLAGVKGAVLVALATDGDDGNSQSAGAVVTDETLKLAQKQGLSPASFMANNDSYNFFRALEDTLITGQTRTNVGDLLFWFYFPPELIDEQAATAESEKLSDEEIKAILTGSL